MTITVANPPEMPSSRRARWDPVVKLTHWSVVLAVLANAVITEDGSAAHVWVGYALLAILALRLLWGLIGPAEARFSAFLPSPKRALAHLRDIRKGVPSEHKSHNPLGALMVYAIWVCLSVIIGTGIAMAGLPDTSDLGIGSRNPSAVSAESGEEGEYGEREEEEGGAAAEVHETAVNLLYLLILLHLAGVVFETRRSGRKVILAMIPGHR